MIESNAALLAEYLAGATVRGLATKYGRSTGSINKRLSRARADRARTTQAKAAERREAERRAHGPLEAAEVAAAPAEPAYKRRRNGPQPIDPRTGEVYAGRVGLLKGALNGGTLAEAETYESWMARRAARTGTAAVVYGDTEPTPLMARIRALEAEGAPPAQATAQAVEESRA